jgi:hypothetical protein
MNMATSAVPTSQPEPESFVATSRALALGLAWGGIMLFVLGWWLGVKHEDLARLVIFLVWLMAVGSFACGIWQYLALARPTATPEQKHAGLLRQRKILGFVLFAGGVILVALGVYLGISFKLAAFGEVVGMCLVGIIAAASGFKALKGERTGADIHPFFDLLRRQHAYFGLVMAGGGLVLALGALVLIVLVKLGPDWFPETAGMFLLGVAGVGGGAWLIVSQSEELTSAKMRVFVLVVGGVVGLILSLGALARAFMWRDEVFGGMRAWQGDRGWHLWLCAYVELIGLGLMFASLLLARTDIRSSAVLRRVLYGYNAVLTGLLLLAMLVVLNIVLFALFPFSFEWSKSRGAHTLSTSTKNLLSNLREPTTIYVFLRRGSLDTELRNFLENCQNQSTKLQVKYVSPDKDFEEYDNLAKRFPESLASRQERQGRIDRGILVVYGDLPQDTSKKTPHAFLPYSRLVEEQPIRTKEGAPKVTVIFKGESEVMKELSFLAQDRKKRKIYFLQGDGELDINNSQDELRRDLRKNLDEFGCGILVEGLKKEQFDVQGLSFGEQLAKEKTANLAYAKVTGPDKRKEVPDDADALIIAGPGVPLDAKTIDALERYMDRGGKLLVFLDIVLDAKGTRLVTTGLEDFLRKYGVLVGSDFPLRVATDDPRVVFATVPKDTTNELASSFVGDPPVVMRTARIVRPDPAAQKYKAEVVLQLDRRDPRLRSLYLEETAIRALENPVTFMKDLNNQGVLPDRISAEPVPVAVAVSEKLLDPGSGKENLKPRLIVFGDAECISNPDIVRNQVSFGWIASGLEWMAEKKGLIGPRPKETSSYAINPQVVNVPRLTYLPGWLMMLSILSLGAGIWVVRRR